MCDPRAASFDVRKHDATPTHENVQGGKVRQQLAKRHSEGGLGAHAIAERHRQGREPEPPFEPLPVEA
jgi:hypothetical protein